MKRMNWKEFAEYLLTMSRNQIVEFATDGDVDDSDMPDDYTSWYFAKIINVDGYDSHFILIDYCGGEEAFAIPLNNYKNEFDDDDRAIVPGYIRRFFKECSNLNGEDDYVYVEEK